MMPPSPDQEMAVVRAVVYASLFDYPLAPVQIVENLEGVAADEARVRAWLDRGPLIGAVLETRDGFWFPAGQAHLVDVRRRREVESRGLLTAHRGTMRLVASLPFVRSVCLSGSLAHLNGTAAADLDLFVVTAPGRVWGVTATVLALARALGRRRALCLNYVVSERALGLQPADAFAASQVMSLQPVTGEAIYRNLIDANPFVTRIFPNFHGRAIGVTAARGALARAMPVIEAVLNVTLAPLYERACASLYRRHLRRKSASWDSPDHVRLDDECLKLHTHSHRAEIAARFERALAACLDRQPVRMAR